MQAQKWEHFIKEADELLDIPSYEEWVFIDKQGNSFAINSNKKDYFCIINARGVFYDGFWGEISDAIIGFYDVDNKLIEKTTLDLLPSIESLRNKRGNQAVPNTTGQYTYNKEKVEKLVQKIKHGKGFVRIYVPVYGKNENFDIKIPCLNNPY